LATRNATKGVMIEDEIRQVRNDLLDWAMTKPEEVRYRVALIMGNLFHPELKWTPKLDFAVRGHLTPAV